MSTAPFPQYRVRRKPPPTIDISERYPSPDPTDPFAPLWALRNRTSSAQGQHPLASDHARQGPEEGGLNTHTTSHPIPMERRRSNSYLFPHFNPTAAHAVPPRSSSAVPPPSGSRENFGYRPPSQSGFVTTGGGASHASKRHAQELHSDTTTRNTHLDLSAFPIRKVSSRNTSQESGALHVLSQHLAKHGRPNVERAQDSSSSIESESNSSVFPTQRQHKSSGIKAKWMGAERSGYESKNPGLATAISFNVGIDVKPTLVRRTTSNGTSNSVFVSLPAKSPQQQQQASPQQQLQPQSRLAKFLSKKSSHEGGYMADGEKKSNRGNARPTHTGPVHKVSISAPLTETFVHQGGQSKIESTKITQDHDRTLAHIAGKVRNGYYTSDTDTEESKGIKRLGSRTKTLNLFSEPRKISAEDTHNIASSNSQNMQAEAGVVAVPLTSAVAAVRAEDSECVSKNNDRDRAEMSWSEVNFEEYYTPITSPRRSYPTPAPSPKPGAALELEPEFRIVREDKERDETRKQHEEGEKRGIRTARKPEMDIKSGPIAGSPPVPASTASGSADGLSGLTHMTEQEQKGKNLRSVKESGLPTLNSIAPSQAMSTMTAPVPSTIASPTPASTRFPSPAQGPPPPPKRFRRRVSNSTTTMQAETTPSPPGQVLPNTHSISNTSIVHVSLISTPTPAVLNEHDEDGSAYVRPRRAPRPPETGVGAGSDNIQLKPETVEKEGGNDLRREGEPNEKTLEVEKTEVPPKINVKAMSENETRMPVRRNTEVSAKATITSFKVDSKLPVSKHGKALSTDAGNPKDMRRTAGTQMGSGVQVEGGHARKMVTSSVSGPVYLPSRERERPTSPPVPLPSYPGAIHKELPSVQPPSSNCSSVQLQVTEHSIPSSSQLAHASALNVYTEDGRKVTFGSLFERQKTAVVFIRHFWCPRCQDYMSVVRNVVRPGMLVGGGIGADEDEVVWKRDRRGRGKEAGEKRREADGPKISFVVISNGAYGMISKYRQIFNLPFRVYTDPSLALYKALGMGKAEKEHPPCSLDSHHQYLSDTPTPLMPRKKKMSYSLRRKGLNTSASSLSDREYVGGYVRHGTMSGLAMVFVRAIKVGMPVWENSGDTRQLGGEFVLGPGLTCTYAHRMQSTKGHAPIEEVLHAAGIPSGNAPSPLPSSSSFVPPSSKPMTHKQENSVNLASPPKSRESHHPQEVAPGTSSRKRTESLSEALGWSRSGTTATSNVVKSSQQPLPPPYVSNQHEPRERRTNMPSSVPAPTPNYGQPFSRPSPSAVRTREEESHWVQERQKGIQKMQEGKGARPKVGELGRAPSSQGTSSVQPSVASKGGRGDVLMTESRSAPSRSLEEEERIVYKAESRRQQDASRGRRPVSRATSSNGHTASIYRR